MNTFKDYLKSKGRIPKTIKSYQFIFGQIKQHASRSSLELEDYTHADVLNYIKSRQSRGLNPRTTNFELNVLRQYFDYQILQGLRYDNPAENIHLKGVVRSKIHKVISEEKLEEFYKKLPTSTPIELRNKVILGLMIYQGLKTAEIDSCRLTHINLEECTIYVAEQSRSNSRTIPLKSKQILSLVQYIEQGRAEINPAKANKTQKFIISTGESDHLRGMFDKLKKQLPEEIENFKQIRVSVITNRLTPNNLRQQQYYFGFRYVDSIERYLNNKVDDLKSELDEVFPLD